MSRNRTIVLVLLVLMAAFTALGVWFSRREEAARDEGLAPLETRAETPAAPTKLSDADRADARTDAVFVDPHVASTPEPTTPPAPDKHVESWTVSGRVLDLDGQPVPALDVFEDGHESDVFARTAGDGSFRFEFPRDYLDVAARSATWSTLRTGSVSKSGPHDGALVVVVPTIALSGRVVDDAGVGIDGARVRHQVDESGLARFPLPLDRTNAIYAGVHLTKDGGAFTFPSFPRVAGTQLIAEADGFQKTDVKVDVDAHAPPRDVTIVMKRTEASARVVRGVVVHADGSAAPKARVQLDATSVHVDAAGAFVIAVPQWLRDETPLVAYETESQAATLPAFGKLVRTSSFPLAPVRLVLGPPPLTIQGRVVDAEGRPLAGWNVGIVHGTSVSQGRIPAITVEDLTAGGSVDARTDESGAFRLAGLLDREYEVFAYESATLLRIASPPIRAGATDVTLKLSADAVIPKLTGRVVAMDGSPIAGATVAVGLVTASEAGGRSWINGKPTRTGPDGAFELLDVPSKFVHLDVGGDVVIPTVHTLDGVDTSRPLRLEVARRCHFRIEGLAGSVDTQWLAAHDAAGQELSVWEFQGNGWTSLNRLQITTDTTRVYAVSETAFELVLYQPYDTVVAKRPLRLAPNPASPDDVTIVRW